MMRQLALQLFDVVVALLRMPGSDGAEELKTLAILCGAGFDTSLLCLANGWI